MGVFKNPKKSIYSRSNLNEGIFPLYYQISISPEIMHELNKCYVKGYFIVRQKRIPTVIAQGLSIGIDASSYIPLDEKRKEAPKPAPPKKKAIKRNYKFPPIQFLQEPLDNADSEEARAEIQENADVVVFVESLEKEHRLVARLSFSTKLTDYFASGKCIFALGCPCR